jgi:beta-lactamase class A
MKNQKLDKKSNKKAGRKISLFIKPIPLYLVIIAFFAAIVGFYINSASGNKIGDKSIKLGKAADSNSSATTIRENNESFLTRHLFLVEGSNDEITLQPMKARIIKYIDEKKKEGTLSSASVYVKNLSQVNSMEINPDELYDPASIMKIPLMLIILRQAESDPGLLKTKLFYKEPFKTATTATIKDKTLTAGQSYTIEELLHYMIVYSDNEAFWLLGHPIAMNEYQKLNSYLGIPENYDKDNEHGGTGNFIANVNTVSRYFRVLFNSTYLGWNNSEYALKLLTQSDYKDGIVKGLGPGIVCAHKFGERKVGNEVQLDEVGIVYLSEKPYIIGVMTRGTDNGQLAKVISNISKIAFEEIGKL